MAGYTDSPAVFMQKCKEIELPAPVQTRLTDLGFTNMARWAYSCSYIPGAADDRAFVTMAVEVAGVDPVPPATLAMLRRLFFESFTMVQAELKSKIERTDEAVVRRIPIAERASRYQAQVRKLRGMVLENELECSDALVDEAMGQFEENRLRYIAWHKCTKRNSELRGIKKETTFQTNSQGLLKATTAPIASHADLASDLLLKSALQRRGLAYDQANLIEFELHNLWVEKLFRSRLKDQPTGYAQISYGQIEDADIALFTFMADQCRTGIVPNALGIRPLDAAITVAMNDPDVVQLLLPLPSSMKGVKRLADLDEPPGDWSETTGAGHRGQGKGKKVKTKAKAKAKSGGKGQGKGQSKERPAARLPAGLEGASITPAGLNICFSYNFKKCSVTNCPKGEHVCTKCFAAHPFMDCKQAIHGSKGK